MSVLREVASVRNGAGIWLREGFVVLQVRGRDAGKWLHAQTTNTVLGLESGQGNLQALLDRQGRLQCFFSLHRWEDEFWVLVERQQVAAFMARVESHLFLEEVSIEQPSGTETQVCLEGPRSLVVLGACLSEEGGLARVEAARSLARLKEYGFAPLLLGEHEVLVFRMSESAEDGFLIVPAPGEAEAVYSFVLDRGAELGLVEVGAAARNTLLLESGMPRWGMELRPDRLISETPLEQLAVAYDKGCYLGQEVVARMKAYGSPKYALCGLLMDDPAPPLPPPGLPLFVEGRRVGEMGRAGMSPTLGGWAGLAYLDREHRRPGEHLLLSVEEGTSTFRARVSAWPMYVPPSRAAFAQRLYDEALAAFQCDPDDSDTSAIHLLEEVLLLAPEFEDAYEALGVILHRHGRTDEAIAVMRTLERLNPQSVMAHTNLSVFYVSKGMIAEAEAEKAKAEQLQFKHALDARQAERQAAAERERIRREAEQRIAMFEEVLAIDPEDVVAVLGLGQSYMQLERHAEAVPFLEKATQLKKDYSAAWLQLGKCREFLGDMDAARAAYEAGIAAASRKGDMIPLREMERRLKSLTT